MGGGGPDNGGKPQKTDTPQDRAVGIGTHGPSAGMLLQQGQASAIINCQLIVVH